MLRTILTLAVSSLALGACQSTRGGGCPPLPAYSPAFQKRAAAELRGLPKGAAVGELVVDYGKMRDACRAGGR